MVQEGDATTISSSPTLSLQPRGSRVPYWVYPTVSTLLVLVAWELLPPLLGVPTFVLPRPTEIAGTLIDQSARLIPNTAVTGVESLGGIFLSIAIGVPLAMLIAYVPGFERSIYPILVSTQAIPKVAVAPLFTIWFGFGLESKLLVAFLVAFFPVLIDTAVGLKSVNPDYVNLVRSMGASEWQILRRIRVPSALPHFFAGLKVAVTLAVIGALVGEFMGADKGLGYLLLIANGYADTKLLFAVITILAMLGIVFFYAVVWIEKLAIPWHVSQRRPNER